MSNVSPAAQDAICLLVSWEMLGADVDPKQVLREMTLPDLYGVKENIERAGEDEFLSPKMVELELMFREDLLREDWSLSQEGDHVSLRFSPLRQGRSTTFDIIMSGESYGHR